MYRLSLLNVVGFLAGALTTAAGLENISRQIRVGLSFRMLLILDTGLALWMVYGFLTVRSHSF
jgi:uncharacterized protein with PQ loop repeat